ncbi:MAG: hypothetical protein H6577_02405 [Lewinellaceae bacterium]|nr:hypothetical protein [Lewinellaceae bacterium]
MKKRQRSLKAQNTGFFYLSISIARQGKAFSKNRQIPLCFLPHFRSSDHLLCQQDAAAGKTKNQCCRLPQSLAA